MKKLLVLCLLFAIACSPAAAEVPDLSGLSYEELVQLREQINLAIWNSQAWKEVTVPKGTWIVGVDIPAGHWSLRPALDNAHFYVNVFDHVDATGKNPTTSTISWQQDIHGPLWSNPFGDDVPLETDVILRDGWYFKNTGTVIFSPYIGHSDFGFDW